jgi:hypothetical protein
VRGWCWDEEVARTTMTLIESFVIESSSQPLSHEHPASCRMNSFMYLFLNCTLLLAGKQKLLDHQT